MKRNLSFLAIIILICGMSSCKNKELTSNIPQKEISVKNPGLIKYWKLTELMGNPVTYPEDVPKEAFISFKEDGKVNGNFGCNSFAGTYTLEKGDRIRFSEMASTKMMCMDMNIENQFMQVLKSADNYNLDGDKLILNRARMAPLARFEAVYMD